MKVGIIGGGSIGLLFAHYLSMQHPVCLYVRTKEQLELIQAEGITLERNHKVEKRFIEVKLYSEWSGLEDVTLIALKQYQLQSIMKLLNEKANNKTTLLFLQNGMGHIKWLGPLKGSIYLGTIEHGALRIKGNHVIHTGIGTTKIAPYRQMNHSFLTEIQLLENPFFPFIIEENFESMLLNKLVVNAVINPLTAILRVKNGEIIENPYYYQLVQEIFNEIELSLQLKDGKVYFENVKNVCAKTAKNQSSMLRDLEENRPTEVDAILGYILDKAAEREISTPIVKSFYLAVKGKECKGEGA